MLIFFRIFPGTIYDLKERNVGYEKVFLFVNSVHHFVNGIVFVRWGLPYEVKYIAWNFEIPKSLNNEDLNKQIVFVPELFEAKNFSWTDDIVGQTYHCPQ